MKFVYIDESGSAGQGRDDVFVMAGILIDAYNLRPATADFDKKLKEMRQQHPSEPEDLKASKIINGDGGWSRVSPEIRKQFFTDVVNQIDSVYAFAMSFESFKKAVSDFDANPQTQRSYWIACSMYLISLIQKKMQTAPKSKGLSVLIFDDNKQEMSNLSDILYKCDAWYNALYARPKTHKGKTVWEVKPSNRFDQIINSAFAIKSEHSSLVQVADIVSYIYRRHLELLSLSEEYAGEKQLYDNWVSKLEPRRKKIGRCPKGSETVDFYKAICHPNWKM